MSTIVLDHAEYAETIRLEWTVFGHMDVSHFLLLFDHATDAFRENIELGRDYANAHERGFVVAEAHLTYGRQVRAGDRVRIRTRLLGVAPRKMHVFHEMRREGEVAVISTAELLLVHTNRASDRAVEFSSEILLRTMEVVRRHAAEALPTQVGRPIRFEAQR